MGSSSANQHSHSPAILLRPQEAASRDVLRDFDRIASATRAQSSRAATLADPLGESAGFLTRSRGLNFLNPDHKENKIGSNAFGTAEALHDSVMYRPLISNTPQPALSGEVIPLREGREWINQVLATIRSLAGEPGAVAKVTVSLPLADNQQVEIQVSLRRGEVHTMVQSASPELQMALRAAWSELRGQLPNLVSHWVEPVFHTPVAPVGTHSTENQTSAMNMSSNPDKQPRQHADQSNAEHSANSGEQSKRSLRADPAQTSTVSNPVLVTTRLLAAHA
jgi:hypothetical protein